jgi:hypothetical protein
VHRMGRDPFSGTTRQWIEGTVALESGYYEVRLFERDADGTTVGVRRLREISGNCRKLDDAIELAIALIIDPTAQLAPKVSNPSTSERATSADARSPNQNAFAADAAAAEPPIAASRARPPLQRATCNAALFAQRDATNPEETMNRRASTFVTADLVAVAGVLPRIAPGVDMAVRQSLDRRERFALRVGALYLPEQARSDSKGSFSYGLTAFEAGACADGHHRRAFWFGCGSLGLGAIHAVVRSPAPFDPGDRIWMAFRVEAGLALQIAGPVWVEARLFELIAPRRWTFRCKIDETPTAVFEQDFFMPGAAIGFGLKFD